MSSIFTSMEVSATALAAQRVRMNLIAENLANAEVTRTPSGQPYRRKGVVLGSRDASTFDHLLNAGRVPGGVEVLQVVESQTPPNLVYNPSHPDADTKGYVTMPNINPVMEMVDLISASRAYEANVTAIQIAKSMVTKTLEIGR